MNTSACDAEVTQLLSARSTTEPDGDRFACDTGAQKWLREPGMLAGSAEDALDCACALYLTASFDTPTN